jgi:hypothetical protein
MTGTVLAMTKKETAVPSAESYRFAARSRVVDGVLAGRGLQKRLHGSGDKPLGSRPEKDEGAD